MSEALNPNKFLEQVEKINEKARCATIRLLKQQKKKKYVFMFPMDMCVGDACYAKDGNDTEVNVFGVGLDDNNDICIAACAVGDGCCEDDFPQEWVKVTELCNPNFCAFYRFVANNIDKAITEAEAKENADLVWFGIQVLDENGNDKYDYIDSFSDGIATVHKDRKCGYINKEKEEIVPCKYDDIDSFYEGLACVLLDGKFGFVDMTGREVIPCKYDEEFSKPNFSDGVAHVYLNGRRITIDKTGKQVSD